MLKLISKIPTHLAARFSVKTGEPQVIKLLSEKKSIYDNLFKELSSKETQLMHSEFVEVPIQGRSALCYTKSIQDLKVTLYTDIALSVKQESYKTKKAYSLLKFICLLQKKHQDSGIVAEMLYNINGIELFSIGVSEQLEPLKNDLLAGGSYIINGFAPEYSNINSSIKKAFSHYLFSIGVNDQVLANTVNALKLKEDAAFAKWCKQIEDFIS